MTDAVPLAVDLCCGLGGWTEGLLAEGYHARGYDIEAHEYDGERYPGELVLQSILDLDGADCADADLIVASPPCTEYSYMAMPWSRAKQIAAALRGEGDFPEGYKGSRTIADLNALFDACFRIQREASAAAGRSIPMVLENVRGAIPWVGRSRWNFGSYHLWGDIPALMPPTHNRLKGGQTNWRDHAQPGYVGQQLQDHFGQKNPGFRFDGSGKSFQSESVARHVDGGRKNTGGCSSGSGKRKAASARIAKIPLPLSQHIARAWLPTAGGRMSAEPDYQAERKLPPGKTCGDCVYGPLCDGLFGAVKRGFTSCDFWPSRFRPAAATSTPSDGLLGSRLASSGPNTATLPTEAQRG